MQKTLRRARLFAAAAVAAACVVGCSKVSLPGYESILGQRTVADVIGLYGAAAESRMKPFFAAAGVTYPPQKITLLATKNDKKLEVWASDGGTEFGYIRTYDIQQTSGALGPKLREGDYQVPEGVYSVIGLNPNSSFHLSFKLNYPNEFDLLHAQRENRLEPGSDIFIHGKASSVGCLAMGDETIEELFVLVEKVGIENTKVVIAPYDPRVLPLQAFGTQPLWIDELYQTIEAEYALYPRADS